MTIDEASALARRAEYEAYRARHCYCDRPRPCAEHCTQPGERVCGAQIRFDAELLANLKAVLPNLEKLLADCTAHWGSEDLVYRFYHQSFKVYGLQEYTEQIVAALTALLPGPLREIRGAQPLNAWFTKIVAEGTGKTFEHEHNHRWLEVTRPILEAFFHAKYMLEMAIKYSKELDEAPSSLPSGWAAFLYLYDLR
jgi:hypothetical protein